PRPWIGCRRKSGSAPAGRPTLATSSSGGYTVRSCRQLPCSLSGGSSASGSIGKKSSCGSSVNGLWQLRRPWDRIHSIGGSPMSKESQLIPKELLRIETLSAKELPLPQEPSPGPSVDEIRAVDEAFASKQEPDLGATVLALWASAPMLIELAKEHFV